MDEFLIMSCVVSSVETGGCSGVFIMEISLSTASELK